MMNATTLVISNHRASSMTYSAGLTGYGYRVEEVRTLESARALLRTGMISPHLIVIDLSFLSAQIAVFIEFVRDVLGDRDTPIIVVGGHADTGAGGVIHLPRPVELRDLVGVLQHG